MAGSETEWSHLRGENFRGQVCDVRRDLPPCQELRHFVAKGVTVVFKQVVGLSSVHARKGSDCHYRAGRWTKPYVKTMASPLKHQEDCLQT